MHNSKTYFLGLKNFPHSLTMTTPVNITQDTSTTSLLINQSFSGLRDAAVCQSGIKPKYSSITTKEVQRSRQGA